MRIKKTLRCIGLFVLFTVFGVIAFLMTSPSSQPARFPLSVVFVGYTNKATKDPIALFTVTNYSRLTVQRFPFVTVLGTGPMSPNERHQVRGLVLKGGEGELLQIPVPTEKGGRWRLMVSSCYDWKMKVGTFLSRVPLFPERFRSVRGVNSFSEWIDN